MTQDPNFPSEIPPVPPPRNRYQADPEALIPRAESGEESGTDGDIESSALAIVSEPSGLTGKDDRLETPGASAEQPSNSPAADAAFGTSSAASDAPAVEITDGSVPWTASDLHHGEEPLPTPTLEPPAGTSRRRRSETASAIASGPAAPADDVWTDTKIPYQPKELGVVDQLLLLLAEAATLWKKGLRWVRSQLPLDLQRQLPDGVLTAVVLGLVMLILALWNPLGAGQKQASPPVSEPVSAELSLGEESRPGLAPSALAPAAESTPEQSLIADIQARVSRLSRSYGADLVQSVEVNLPQNTLGVNVAEAWYGLLASQQDEVAQDIFAQAQGLSFGTLQLRDPNGLVVARNPVVGPNIVVLRRLRSLDTAGGVNG